jgi:hypothetical protein
MDRINKFLNSRQVKDKKTIKHKDKSYVITKEDLKKIRAYKSRKCLDASFKTSSTLKITNDTIEPITPKIKKDNSDLCIEKLKKKYANKKKTVIKAPSKNLIVDIYENDNSILTYKQEWIYSIKDSYNSKIEDLKFDKNDLTEELRRVYLKQFRPREIKNKKIEDLLPQLPNAKDLRPFPEEKSKEWKIEGKKQIFDSTVYASNETNFKIFDLRYFKELASFDLPEKIEKFAVSTENNLIAISSLYSVYLIRIITQNITERSYTCDYNPVLTLKNRINDINIGDTITILTKSKHITNYNIESLEICKTTTFKNQRLQKLKFFNQKFYASTSNGLIVDEDSLRNISCIIDFDVKNKVIYSINNLSRLIVIDAKNRITKNAIQTAVGKKIRIHKSLNMFAILFSTEIGIYKIVEEECVPVKTIPGKFRTIEWDPEYPFLYSTTSSKVHLFS